MTLTDSLGIRQIEASSEIRLLGITVDQILSFVLHAQNAAAKAMQSLGSLFYLRAGSSYGISPKIARHLATAKSISSSTMCFPYMVDRGS